MDAVEHYVATMGWSVDEDDYAGRRVVAHVDTQDAYAMQRDTWTFRVKPGFVTVWRRTELGDTNGTSFVTSDQVCGTYTYVEEDLHLMQIGLILDSGTRLARR